MMERLISYTPFVIGHGSCKVKVLLGQCIVFLFYCTHLRSGIMVIFRLQPVLAPTIHAPEAMSSFASTGVASSSPRLI